MCYRLNFPRPENQATNTFAIIKGDAYTSSAVLSKRALWHVFTTNNLAIVVQTVSVPFKPQGNVSPFQLFCIAVRVSVERLSGESDVRFAALIVSRL